MHACMHAYTHVYTKSSKLELKQHRYLHILPYFQGFLGVFCSSTQYLVPITENFYDTVNAESALDFRHSRTVCINEYTHACILQSRFCIRLQTLTYGVHTGIHSCMHPTHSCMCAVHTYTHKCMCKSTHTHTHSHIHTHAHTVKFIHLHQHVATHNYDYARRHHLNV